jgi:Trypsin
MGCARPPSNCRRRWSRLVDNMPTEVSGWGTTEPNGATMSSVLMWAPVAVFNTTECRDIYLGILKEEEMCAGATDGACFGDEGSGLSFNKTIYGIATWYNSCGSDGLPGVYVQVSKFTAWIQRVTQQFP